ncbi:MAG: HD domain-containing protein [Bdellovibrionota bacterium]
MKSNLDGFINFITEVDKLKNIERKTLTYDGKRHENSAEHSWHLALAVLVFAENANEKIDVLKCLKMSLLHDLVEIYAGDQIIYAEDKNKFTRELSAAKKIFSLLPKHLEEEFLELWVEFEKKETPESKFVGSLDRFLPLRSNILNKGYTWEKHKITVDQVYKLNQSAIKDGCDNLWEKTDEFLKDSIAKVT